MSYNTFKPIVQKRLVFAVDAANRKSYPDPQSGTTAFDLVNNQNNGTLNNGVGFSSGAWTFDGINDYIECNSLINLIGDDPQGTIEVWVKHTSTTGSQNYVTFADTNLGTFVRLYNFQDKVFAAARDTTINQWVIVLDNSSTTAGEWIHAVVTQDGTEPILYINGIEEPQSFSVTTDKGYWLGSNSLIDNCNIGRLNFQNPPAVPIQYLNGSLAQVRYYNRALSTSEIRQNYDALKWRFR